MKLTRQGNNRRFMFFSGAAIGASALGLLGACSSIVPPLNLKQPEVAFSDLSISDLGLSQIKFVVSLDAKNPNDIDLPLSDAKFELALMGSQFANGIAKENQLIIPKNGTKVIPIEFIVPTSAVIDLIRKANLKDLSSFSYAIKGSSRWGNGPFPINFERKGDLSALKNLSDLLRGVLRP